MDLEKIKILELVMVFGAGFAFIGWQLWSLRRDRIKQEKDERKSGKPSADKPQS